MGTYNLADSITGEAIPEGTEVVAFLLADGGSEATTSYLFARMSERFKLASLPIKGVWNGSVVEAAVDDSLAVQSAIYAANSQAPSFSKLQEELYTSCKKEIPAPEPISTFFAKEPPSQVTFSLFVTKPGSIDLVVNNKTFSKNLGSTQSAERAKIEPMIPLLLHHASNIRSSDSDVAMDAYRYFEQISKTIFFETGSYRFDGLETPLTAGALSSFDDSPFSCRLGYFLESKNLYRHKAAKKTAETGALPDGYDEAFTGIYQAKTMSMGMKYMSLSFTPATGRHRSYKDTSRMALLRHMLQQEIETYLENVTDELSQDALRQVDEVLAPVRQDVAKLVKARNSFATKVEKFEKEYGR